MWMGTQAVQDLNRRRRPEARNNRQAASSVLGAMHPHYQQSYQGEPQLRSTAAFRSQTLLPCAQSTSEHYAKSRSCTTEAPIHIDAAC